MHGKGWYRETGVRIYSGEMVNGQFSGMGKPVLPRRSAMPGTDVGHAPRMDASQPRSDGL
eukprot:3857082-Rhodomonas_salina.2